MNCQLEWTSRPSAPYTNQKQIGKRGLFGVRNPPFPIEHHLKGKFLQSQSPATFRCEHATGGIDIGSGRWENGCAFRPEKLSFRQFWGFLTVSVQLGSRASFPLLSMTSRQDFSNYLQPDFCPVFLRSGAAWPCWQQQDSGP